MLTSFNCNTSLYLIPHIYTQELTINQNGLPYPTHKFEYKNQ